MKATIKRVLIALNLQHLDTPGLVFFLRTIAAGLTGNAHFTAADITKLPVKTADMLTQAGDLETTHLARGTNKSQTLTNQEHDEATTVIRTITDTANFVEGLGNQKAAGDLPLAAEIITSVGFTLKKEFVQHQRSFEVVGTAKGQAHLRTKAAGPRTAYLWQYNPTPANAATWSFPIVTIGAEVFITALTSATEYGFRHAIVAPVLDGKPTVAAGTEEPVWSDVIKMVIT